MFALQSTPVRVAAVRDRLLLAVADGVIALSDTGWLLASTAPLELLALLPQVPRRARRFYDRCSATYPNRHHAYECTRRPGHGDRHHCAAVADGRVLAVWS